MRRPLLLAFAPSARIPANRTRVPRLLTVRQRPLDLQLVDSAAEDQVPGKLGVGAELFLDAQQLVVLGYAV